jgi:hypothetical protein
MKDIHKKGKGFLPIALVFTFLGCMLYCIYSSGAASIPLRNSVRRGNMKASDVDIILIYNKVELELNFIQKENTINAIFSALQSRPSEKSGIVDSDTIIIKINRNFMEEHFVVDNKRGILLTEEKLEYKFPFGITVAQWLEPSGSDLQVKSTITRHSAEMIKTINEIEWIEPDYNFKAVTTVFIVDEFNNAVYEFHDKFAMDVIKNIEKIWSERKAEEEPKFPSELVLVLKNIEGLRKINIVGQSLLWDGGYKFSCEFKFAMVIEYEIGDFIKREGQGIP